MTEEKIVRAIRISKEMDSHIKKYVDGFSAWVENKYRNEFMQIEDIIRTIERHKKSIVMLEKEVKELEEKNIVLIDSLSRKEIEFILESEKRLTEESKKYVVKSFNNSFGRDLSVYEFMTAMEELKPKTI